MLPIDIKHTIKQFISSINRNSPLKSASTDLKHYKYPYKPALVIAILIHNKDPLKLFNQSISLDDLDNPILKTYYELITNSRIFFNYLCAQNSKHEWLYGYKNQSTKKLVRQNIFENPAKYLVETNSDFWRTNPEKHTLQMNLNVNSLSHDEICDIKQQILDAAHKRLCECIPDYYGFSLCEIIAYYETIYEQAKTNTKIINEVLNDEQTIMERDYLYSKRVKERDNKCVICCNGNPFIIQACHIKPFAQCTHITEAIDIENGITLCANHHLLFDKGCFSFDDHWKIIISPKWSTNDLDVLIKTFEPCYQTSNDRRSTPNRYLAFHRKEVFLH